MLLDNTTSTEPILPCYPIVVFKLLWNVKKYELYACLIINLWHKLTFMAFVQIRILSYGFIYHR